MEHANAVLDKGRDEEETRNMGQDVFRLSQHLVGRILELRDDADLGHFVPLWKENIKNIRNSTWHSRTVTRENVDNQFSLTNVNNYSESNAGGEI